MSKHEQQIRSVDHRSTYCVFQGETQHMVKNTHIKSCRVKEGILIVPLKRGYAEIKLFHAATMFTTWTPVVKVELTRYGAR